MLNRLDAKTIDTYDLNSTFSYLGEEDTDKSTNGTPVPDKIKEDGKRKGVIGKIGGIGADSNEPTRNGRRYPLELWQNVEKSEYFIEGMANRCIVGECDHPQERLDYSIPEGAIVLTKYDIQNDGKVYTEFDILDTLPGRTLKTYFDAGCKLGVSSRGLGEEVVVNGETIIDPKTYQFYCFDAVVFPAVKSARMELIESTSPKKESLIKSITKEIKNCKTLDECLFIEDMSKNVNLYLDEIKEAINMKKEDLNKKNNISNLFNQLKESTDEDIKKKLSSEILKYIPDVPTQMLIRNILFDPDNTINWDNVETYIKDNMPEFSINENKKSGENNKIKISDTDTYSDEDTTEKDKDSDLQILAEIQEKLKVTENENNSLKEELEQKTSIIQNLVAKSYSQNVKLQEQFNISKKLISNQKEYDSLKLENKKLESNNNELNEQLNKVTKMYERLRSVNNELSTIVEKLNNKYLSNKELIESLNKKIDSNIKLQKNLKFKNNKLEESLNIANKSNENSSKLSESISNLQKQINSLKENNNNLTSQCESNKSIIKNLTNEKDNLYLKYNESLDKYIKAVCEKYNLNQKTLKRMLGENYTIDDIDKIAEKLRENILKINSLPFTNMVPDRQVVVENIGIPDTITDKEANENLENFQFMLESKNN